MAACGGCLGLGEPPRPATCATPRPIDELATSELEATPFLSSDRLEILFSSNRETGNLRLLYANRERHDEDFMEVRDLSDLGVTGATVDPFLEADGLTMWFSTLSSALGAEPELHRATRTTRGTPRFSAAEPVVGMGAHPTMTADGLTLFFSRRSGALYSIFRATRTTTGAAFDGPEELTEVRGDDLVAADLLDPSISPDGDRLLFATSTGGSPSRIYESDRLNGTFEPAFPETDTGEIDMKDSDQDPAFHRGGETFVFASNRGAQAMNFDLYLACE